MMLLTFIVRMLDWGVWSLMVSRRLGRSGIIEEDGRGVAALLIYAW